jgi:DNA polymerase III sliding clamp (beta) subunit (PCNA family)
MCATFDIFKKLPKESNHLMGENSTNLVTLTSGSPSINLLGLTTISLDRFNRCA